MENVDQMIQFGFVSNTRLDALFCAMNMSFIPATIKSDNWPENVRKDYIRSLHKFMASLTEAVNHQKGKTVLYVPAEDMGNIELAAKDKDLVQRLESTVIHWTRQIKEVVGNQDSAASSESAGPLDEIAFWRDRTVDLSGISEQLNRPGVTQILQVRTERADLSLFFPPTRADRSAPHPRLPPCRSLARSVASQHAAQHEGHRRGPCCLGTAFALRPTRFHRGAAGAGGGKVVVPQTVPHAVEHDPARLEGGQRQPAIPAGPAQPPTNLPTAVPRTQRSVPVPPGRPAGRLIPIHGSIRAGRRAPRSSRLISLPAPSGDPAASRRRC